MNSDRPEILQLNHFFEPNPFNTGPAIPILAPVYVQSPTDAFLDDAEPGPMSDAADSEPDLSSSAGNTPASTSHALPLDHPYIKHIWNDSRFDAVRIHHPGDIGSYGYHSEAYMLLSHPHPGRDDLTAASLNPLAKPFVPFFTPSPDYSDLRKNLPFIDRPAPDFLEEGRLSPLHFDSGFGAPSLSNLHTLEEAHFGSFPPVFMSDFPTTYPIDGQNPAGWFYPSFPLHAPQNYMDGEAPTGHSTANARLFYPPPPQNRQNVSGETSPMDLRLHADYVGSASGPLFSTLPLAYTPLLLAALNPHLVPQDRDVFIRSVFEYVDQWDACNLRELAVRVVVTVFGPEEQGKQREAVMAEAKAVDEEKESSGCRSSSSSQPNEVLPPLQTISVPIPDQVFSQLIIGLCTQFQVDERLGEDYKIGFLTELTNAVFRRFRLLFATVSPSCCLSLLQLMMMFLFIRSE